MQGVVLILVMAIVVEALVEYGKSIGKAFSEGSVKVAVTHLAAIAVGITLCFAAGCDLFDTVGVGFGWSWLGKILTGIIISRGANYVSDFVKKLQEPKGV